MYVGGFVTSIGEHGIMKNIYVLTQKTEPQDPPGRAVRRRCILRYCDILYRGGSIAAIVAVNCFSRQPLHGG